MIVKLLFLIIGKFILVFNSLDKIFVIKLFLFIKLLRDFVLSRRLDYIGKIKIVSIKNLFLNLDLYIV